MCFVIDSILDLIGDIYTTLLFIPCFDQDYGLIWGFPGGSDGKESPSNAGDPGVILGWENPWEKEITTHSNILAWRTLGIGEPGGLQSMGSQGVRNN